MPGMPLKCLRPLAVLSTTLLLGACTTLGPDYREPEVEWLAQWQPDLYGQAVAAQQQPFEQQLQFWWRLLDDPLLNDLIAEVQAANPTLRIAGLRILESRAALGRAGATRYPQLQELSGNAAYVDSRQHGGAQDVDRSFTSYDTAFSLGWELDFWGRFRRGIESADAAFFASVSNYQDVQLLLNAQLVDLYFRYRTTLARIDIARRNSEIQKRSYEITERIYRSGQDSELDLQQAKTQYLATLSTIPVLEAALIKVRNAIAVLLGRPPGPLPELAGARASLPLPTAVDVGAVPARLMMRRPDIRAAAWQVAAQSAQIGIAEADYYPSISLFGSLDWSGNSIDGSPNTGTLALGPAFSWNLFDHGLIRNNVRLQDARLQQAIENFQNSVLLAAKEIDDAAIDVVKTAERQAVLHDSVVAAERSLEIANTLYQEGYAGFQRVLDAQRAMFSQAERELLNQGDHLSAVVALYRALGGGWQPTTIDDLIPARTRDTMEERTDWGDMLRAPLPQQIDSRTSETSDER
ncbi:outer membrane protein [Marinobacterium nitratireducens]|uniref:Outer membrane protein n=1 Tax=Marinobacterium nitratireducens TaxID=518897 RepID=A0A917Z6U2_9GAMM|nr:TolC family protein [Marinobacterium nitratireducens]GGO76712.1 outer membrane protein [Marinobacterium nitratireducens]